MRASSERIRSIALAKAGAGIALAVLACLGWGETAAAGPRAYDIALSLSPTWALDGRLVLHGTAACDWDELVLRVYQPENLDVTSVEVNGASVPRWEESEDASLLRIPASLERGQTYALTATFTGQVPPFRDQQGYGTFATSERVVVLAASYPMLAAWDDDWIVGPLLPWGDPVVADVADYRCTLEAPEGWTVISGAEEVSLSDTVTLIEGTKLRELAIVLLQDHTVQTAEVGDVLVRSFSLPEHTAGAAEALRITAESLHLFADLFGPYPFPTLDVAAVPLRRAVGVEYPGLILGDVTYYARWEAEPLFFPMIFAHEVAHQWWYAQVGNDQVGEPWVDEALATYASGLYFEAEGRLDEIIAYWRDSFWRGHRRNPDAEVDSPLWAFPNGEGYGGIVYSGGALMLHELRICMGDAAFFNALQAYLSTHKWQLASGDDLLEAFAQHHARCVRTILDRWLPHR